MIKRLIVFDFDGTLMNTPEPEIGKKIWSEKTGKIYPHLGWWSKPESLDLNIFDIKPFPSVLKQLEIEKSKPNTSVIILTSRMAKLQSYIQAILNKNNIHVDRLELKKEEKTKGERILEFIANLPDLEEISVYDDRQSDIDSYKEIEKQIPDNIQFNIYLVNNNKFSIVESKHILNNIINDEIQDFLNISEQFDSPEIKSRLKNMSPEELKQMANVQPYKNKFNTQTYRGKEAEDLHDLISNTMVYSKDTDAFAIVEYLYRLLVKEIPEFKNFIIEKAHSESKTFYLFLKKEKQIKDNSLDDDYSVKIHLWIKYHKSGDKILNYEKDKIYLLFSPQITVTRISIGLNDILKQQPSSGEFSDEMMDNFMEKTNKLLYGSPDNEDIYVKNKYKLYYKNLQFNTFVKILPKLRNNLLGFYEYVKNKYDILL